MIDSKTQFEEGKSNSHDSEVSDQDPRTNKVSWFIETTFTILKVTISSRKRLICLCVTSLGNFQTLSHGARKKLNY